MKEALDWLLRRIRTNASERSSQTTVHSQQQRMEAMWRERALRLSKRPELAAPGENALPVIVLAIGAERYGIDVSDVAEVLPPLHITPVPGAPAVFAGVVNVHGEIRPVVDLRRWLSQDTISERPSYATDAAAEKRD